MQIDYDYFDRHLDPAVFAPPTPPPLLNDMGSVTVTSVNILNSYVPIFLAAFLVTLLATPLVRRMAINAGIIDLPDQRRKKHPYPVAYLGGVAVFLGLIVAIGMSYVLVDPAVLYYRPVPIAIVIGMVAIAFTGLADDVWGWDPHLKIAGQLVAAAALAWEEVGVYFAAGVLKPIFGEENLLLLIPTPVGEFSIDIVYWVGTALIAIFVLGGCNAANLMDGLDGLLSGIVAIVAVGLLCISLFLFSALEAAGVNEETTLAGARIVLCVALLGAVLGFLPHNFNPATIFLGDCGSLLLGYLCVVIILMLGEMGQTHLVFAGLIVFAVPIMDTTLAIIRRWLARVPMSSADDQHIHHQLRRAMGGVKRAVLSLYAISLLFAIFGVVLAALVMFTEVRVRVIYAIAIVLFSSIGVVAVKAARRKQILLVAQHRAAMSTAPASPAVTSPAGDSARRADGGEERTVPRAASTRSG